MALRSPLPRICIAMGFPTAEALVEHARREVEEGETFFEFRLDYLENPYRGVEAIREFLTAYPEVTILATCRRHQNRGHFNGSIEEQIRILDAAIDSGAKAIDIEIESADNIAGNLDRLRGRAWVLLSYHNYDGTPAMEAVLRRMQRVSADAIKIVTTAHKPSDNLRALSLAKANPRSSLIVLAMGEIGFATRVLSPAYGGLYTYAAPNSGDGTASGQVTARLLRTLYRIGKFTKSAKVYGVVADPVRHSISPAVHNRAFQSRRMDAVYLPFLVKPAQLKDFFTLADGMPVTGFSVTIPHKQKILRYLESVDPLARRVGAVNTVWKKRGRWYGTNTDTEAVTAPLAKRIKLSKSQVLVAGNGGAARAAAFALAEAGAKVAIVGRNPDRVRVLARACDGEGLTREEAEARHFDALVHATPLGMHPHPDACFFEKNVPADVVLDMVYNPHETALLHRAGAEGKTVIHGVEMFIEQAVRQFELWTGETAPRAVMERAAIEALTQARCNPAPCGAHRMPESAGA